jgi:hypothetical protein
MNRSRASCQYARKPRESFMKGNSIRGCSRPETLQSRFGKLKMPMLLQKRRSGRETGGLGISTNQQIRILCSGDRQSSVALWVRTIARASKAISVVCALLIASNLSATNLNADESQAALCAKKVRGFVDSIDELLTGDANDVYVFREPIRKYMPATGCNVEEVISISKTSKFFVQAYDWSPAYTIIFRSSRFDITFGLRKDTGNIEYPAAQTRLPTR